jgi:hypothetical protein
MEIIEKHLFTLSALSSDIANAEHKVASLASQNELEKTQTRKKMTEMEAIVKKLSD